MVPEVTVWGLVQLSPNQGVFGGRNLDFELISGLLASQIKPYLLRAQQSFWAILPPSFHRLTPMSLGVGRQRVL